MRFFCPNPILFLGYGGKVNILLLSRAHLVARIDYVQPSVDRIRQLFRVQLAVLHLRSL